MARRRAAPAATTASVAAGGKNSIAGPGDAGLEFRPEVSMHRAAGRVAVFAVVVVVGSGAAKAQAPSPSPFVSPCLAPEYRQFDFWVGDWDVLDPAGNVVGTNKITREYDGCVVQEHWEARGPQKQIGSSFNTYNPGTRQWHQTWVDSTGGFLLLDGAFADGRMVLSADMTNKRGRLKHRIAWTPQPDGRVRQFWETSSDDGQTWKPSFDGMYVRAKR